MNVKMPTLYEQDEFHARMEYNYEQINTLKASEAIFPKDICALWQKNLGGFRQSDTQTSLLS